MKPSGARYAMHDVLFKATLRRFNDKLTPQPAVGISQGYLRLFSMINNVFQCVLVCAPSLNNL